MLPLPFSKGSQLVMSTSPNDANEPLGLPYNLISLGLWCRPRSGSESGTIRGLRVLPATRACAGELCGLLLC
jgi:hypothetical protein